MAKKSMVQREVKRQKLITKYSEKRKQIKDELKSVKTYSEKTKLYKKLEKLPRNSSEVRLRRRCWKTGRSRGVYKDFGLCRHSLRQMAHQCLLPGVIKSSW